jgi:hypothetical protein
MDKSTLLILSGIFAVSNMGQKLPSVEKVAGAIQYPPSDANASACMFAEQYMETEAHERIFTKEVKMWMKSLKENEKLYRRSSPDIFKLLEDAKVEHAKRQAEAEAAASQHPEGFASRNF